MTDTVWIVLVMDFTDYITQSFVDSVWHAENDAYNRKEELNKEFDSADYKCYGCIAIIKDMEIN